MSKAEDITNLFRRFGGDAGTYQEIVEHDQADVAKRAWPMLGQILPQTHAEAPSARAGVAGSALRQRQPDEPVRALAKPPLQLTSLGALPAVDPPWVEPTPSQALPATEPEPVVALATGAMLPVPEMPEAEPVVDYQPPPMAAVVAPIAPLPTPAIPPQIRVPVQVPIAPPARLAIPVPVPAPVHVPSPPPVAAKPPNDLKQMFDRMSRVPAHNAAADSASSPLKRLIKW